MSATNRSAESSINEWLEQVVIGLNLCPFARKPYEDDRIRIVTEETSRVEDLLVRLVNELRFLESEEAKKIETTLVVVPNMLQDFDDYLWCLSEFNELVVGSGYEGVFQVASFHPAYQFEDTEPNDKSNLTNRSPYPVFHLIREASLTRVLAAYENPELIPEKNIKLMEGMENEKLEKLFPWLY